LVIRSRSRSRSRPSFRRPRLAVLVSGWVGGWAALLGWVGIVDRVPP